MKVLRLVFFALIAISFCDDDEFKFDKDVMILTESTFDKAVKKYEYLLIFFYAPWCEHCKRFHPEYEKAATVLRKENLYLAKVDATVEKALTLKYLIQSFPKIQLFIKGEAIEYIGERKESEVIKWMRKQTGPITKDLKTVEEVEQFKKDNDVVLIYFGSDKEDIAQFTRTARKRIEFPFGIVKSEDVIKKYTNPQTIILFKNFDEKRNELVDIHEIFINEFIEKNSFQKVMKFDEKTVKIIFGKEIPAIILFASEQSEKWGEYEILMRNVSEKINGKLKVILTDIKEGRAKRLAELIDIKKNDLPSVRILDTRNYRKDFRKYKMEGEINEKNILQFVEDWDHQKLKRYLKTAEEPKDNNGDVHVVVGKTFERDVIKNDKDVMILFYAPWCGHCKAFHPIYEEIAKKLKEKNHKLILAKIDATKNEVESIKISAFPTIKFYPGNKKDKVPLDYNGDRSVEDIIKFIKNNAATPIVYDEEKK